MKVFYVFVPQHFIKHFSPTILGCQERVLEIVCYLANLQIVGSKFSTDAHGKSILNVMPLAVNGFDLELIQDKSLINCSPSKLIGKFVSSTQIVARNVPEDSLNKLIETIHKITVLLSLATDSQVRFYKWNNTSNDSGGQWNVNGIYSYFRPPLCTINSQYIVQLVEGSYSTFERIETSHKLRSAVDLFVTSEAVNLPVELKLATIFILLENLKSSYAENNGYCFSKGYYIKNGQRGSFKPLLVEMFQSVGMSPELSKVVKLRNQIIHSGLSQLDFEEQFNIFSFCKELAGEYLLRLLGYDGVFYLHTTSCLESKSLSN